MKAYKGFDKDLKCRGFQYEVGKTYEEDKAELCNSGFHACLYPQDCFGYYPPSNSRYCLVELDDIVESKDQNDTKVCGKKIKIIKELTIEEMTTASVEYVLDLADKKESGNRSSLNGGDWSSLNGGDWSSLNGGNRSSLNGGNWSSLNGGNRSSLNGGDWSSLNGGNRSSLNGGNRSSLNGGYGSSLKGGDYSVVYGGENSKVKGGLHSVLAIQLWDNYKIKKIVFAEVDGKKIKSDTWYKLEKGEFVEVEDD